jgi:hypothetical protein
VKVTGKGREHVLPLPVDVGQALEGWLRLRPPALDRAVFVRLRAPRQRLTVTGLSGIIARLSDLAGIDQIRARAGTQPRLITEFVPVIEAWLRADISLKASVIHERLVAQHGFTGHYQRVKTFLVEARPRVAAELESGDDNVLRGLHRRFEVVAGAQAQVDWGEEGDLLAHVGIAYVYSFHMTLSYSRDPFTCFTTSMDLATFWDCHRRAFAHFGGVPGSIVYDRTKTVVKRHVCPGVAVPLHPEAAAFADHYGVQHRRVGGVSAHRQDRVERPAGSTRRPAARSAHAPPSSRTTRPAWRGRRPERSCHPHPHTRSRRTGGHRRRAPAPATPGRSAACSTPRRAAERDRG